MLKFILGLLCFSFCLTGIIKNWKSYNIFDFIVVTIVTILPFIIYKIISKNKNNKSNKPKEPRNIIISAPSSPNNQNLTIQTAPTPAQNNNSQPTTVPSDNATPKSNISNKIPAAYSEIEIQNDLRILNDCIKLMQTTNNFETFFNRCELAMQKSSALESTGLNINPEMTLQAILQLKNSSLERILQTVYEKELSSINSLKTTKGKISRIDKLLETLSKYREDLISVSNYKKIVLNLHKLKKELETEQHTAISEEYQAAYQKSIADAERIKKMYEALETERYQIIGEPDCKHYKICRQNNGKVYYLSEYQIGQTAPPFHEKCTCTVVPYFDDEF